MPDGARKALPLLERALSLEPDYALAHGYAAWCHEIIFVWGGAREENRLGGIRHSEAAIQHGRDDANALALGGFVMGLVGHDREAARPALDAALALSPSCAFAFLFGSVVLATGGDADLGVEWGKCALRLSPFDPGNYGPYFAITLGRFQHGNCLAAAEAVRKCIQANPNWSYGHMLLAATHAELGRIDESTSSAQRVAELQPRIFDQRHVRRLGLHASIAKPLSEALRMAGLPM